MVFPRFSSTLNPFQSFLSFFINVSQLQSMLISFNQFDSVKNAGSWREKNVRCRETIARTPCYLSLHVAGSGRGTVGKCTGPKWSKMVQTTHFGQNDLIPNRTLAFARPKWTKLVHFLVHFGLKRSILVHLGPPTVPWPILKHCLSSRSILKCKSNTIASKSVLESWKTPSKTQVPGLL